MRKFSRLFFEQAGRPQALLIAAALLAQVGLNGCSAGIALSQKTERTMTNNFFETGSSRKAVERKLGKPTTMELNDDTSKVLTYQEKVYRRSRFWYDPGGRALWHVIYDLRSLGLWELVATPMETGGKIFRATHKVKCMHTVVYDAEDRVVSHHVSYPVK